MERAMYWARLPVLLILVFLLGFLLETRPGAQVFHLPGEQGSIAVPASLEGWQLGQGDGRVIVTGHTRFHLAELEVERTSLPAGTELTRIGDAMVPASRATYAVTFPGGKLRMVQQDLYFMMEQRYVRVGLRFPAILEPYFWSDVEYIAGHVRLAQ